MDIFGAIVSVIALVFCSYLMGVITSNRVWSFFFKETKTVEDDDCPVDLKMDKYTYDKLMELIQYNPNKEQD